MFGRKKDVSVTLSTPKSKIIRGYEIKRMPFGRTLEAMATLKELPQGLLGACFPGLSPEEVLQRLTKFDADMLLQIVGNGLLEAPKYIVSVFSKLTGIPEQDLLESDEIGMDGIMEMIAAWVEVNGVENFIRAARGLAEGWKAAGSSLKPSIGSKGSSPRA